MKQPPTPRVDLIQGLKIAAGPATLSNRSLLLFLIPSSMVILIGNISRIEQHVIEWSLVNLLGYVVPVSVILALRSLVLRAGKYLPWATLLVLLLAGVARGTTIYLLGVYIPVVPDWGYAIRLFGAITLILGSFGPLGIYESSRLRHLEAIGELQQKQLEVTELRGSLKEKIRQQRQNLLDQVTATIRPVIYQLKVDLKTVPSDALVRSLQNSVENVVRPLSHRISESDVESLALASQIQRATNAKPISTLPKRVVLGQMFIPSLLMASIASFLITATEIYYPTAPVLAGLILLFWVYVGSGFSKVLLNKEVKTFTAFLYVTALMNAITGASFVSLTLFDLYVDMMMYLQYVSALLVISYLIFALQLARTQRAITEQETGRLLDELERLNAKLKQEAWLNRRNIATTIHGSVQSAFYAAAIKLNNSPSPSPELIDDIERDMNQALEKLFGGEVLEKFDSGFSSLTELWDSVANISLIADPKVQKLLQHNQILGCCTLEIIREGVSNAIRHAGAKNIEVQLSISSPSSLEIQVKNDGSPLPPEVTKGFGSELLSQLTTSWSLDSGEKTNLRAEMAI